MQDLVNFAFCVLAVCATPRDGHAATLALGDMIPAAGPAVTAEALAPNFPGLDVRAAMIDHHLGGGTTE